MKQIDPHTFSIPKALVGWMRAAIWIFAAFVLFFAALPFLPDQGPHRNAIATSALSLVGMALFGILGWYSYRSLRQLPMAAVSVDNDGLWPAHIPKDRALVRWDRVHSVREHPFMQRLDLLDMGGNVLVKLEYQLSEFGKLRVLIADKLPRSQDTAAPSVFRKKPAYHLINICALLCFLMLGLYVGKTRLLIGYGGALLIVLGGLREYLTTVTRIAFDREFVAIGYPVRTRTFRREEIGEILVGEQYRWGGQHSVVTILVKDGREAIRLNALGVGGTELYQRLRQWAGGGTHV